MMEEEKLQATSQHTGQYLTDTGGGGGGGRHVAHALLKIFYQNLLINNSAILSANS
jgi:hypothetical protein